MNKLKNHLLNFVRGFLKIEVVENIVKNISANKSSSSFWVKILPPHTAYSKPSIRKIKTKRGIKFQLDISDLVDWYLYFGIKENAHEKLYKLCKPGDVYFDIGTNIGAVLLHIAEINKEGSIYGFEPDPVNFRNCLQNIELNEFKNIQINNIGLGEKESEFQIFVPNDRNRGMNRLRQVNNDLFETQKVKINSLDNFVEKYNIKKIDLIKIDTEGFEMKVLLGANETLKKFHPQLFIELDDDNLKEQDNSALELIQFLLSMQYRLMNAEDGTVLDDSYNYTGCHFDIITY